jgi:hypothetical protein
MHLIPRVKNKQYCYLAQAFKVAIEMDNIEIIKTLYWDMQKTWIRKLIQPGEPGYDTDSDAEAVFLLKETMFR